MSSNSVAPPATPGMARLWLKPLATAVAGAAYLGLIHVTTAPGEPSDLGAAIAIVPPLVLSGCWAGRSLQAQPLRLAGWLALCALVAVLWPWLRDGFAWLYLLQHAGAFAALAWVFGRSLRAGRRPLISAIYLRLHGRLPAPVARYTRGVTLLWTGVGTAMALASLLLFALGAREHWSMLANLLTPAIVVAVFVVEYGVRVCVLPAELRTGLRESLLAFRALPATGPRERA